MPANACGQLPFRLDPVTHYASRQHPKALGMSIVGFSDAMSDFSFDLRKIDLTVEIKLGVLLDAL